MSQCPRCMHKMTFFFVCSRFQINSNSMEIVCFICSSFEMENILGDGFGIQQQIVFQLNKAKKNQINRALLANKANNNRKYFFF